MTATAIPISPTGSNSNDPTMTIADIARRLNMSETFVYRQASTGKLPCYHIGGTHRKSGAIRFSESQFQSYLTNQMDNHHPVWLKPTGTAASCTAIPNTVTRKLNDLLKKKNA